MTPRRIAVVSYYFPPSTSVGGARWAAMAGHLRELGHEVTIVTSDVHGTMPDDRDRGVLRTGDLATSQRLRTLLRRPPLPEPGAAAAVTPAPALLTRVLVPDSYVAGWLPWAVGAVRRLLRAGSVDALVTSGPPSAAHLVGLLLGRRRPVWLADFRDGWRFEPPAEAGWPTGAQDRLDAWLERRVARGADAALGVTRPIAEDLRDRLGARAVWLPNGWDPELDAEVAATDPPPGATRAGWATIVHTGTLSGPWGRDPRPLLEALRRVNADPGDGRPVRLVLAGRPSSEDERLLADAGLGDAVVHLGLVPRLSALALQRAADALVLVTSDNRSEATGKLFEYLASGRPVVAVARANEAARIVAETGAGVAVARDDAAGLERALRDVASGALAARHAPHGLERFTYPGPAVRLAEVVEEALRRRR